MSTRNVGVVAHVDAGKTSLTERLLHTAGVLAELGSVDAGTTLTDSLALERSRGITIRSAVASVVLGGVPVNLLDTPGHPDFVAEVERVLGVLDGAVLVVSAVEGVQAQTRVLLRTLRRLHVPTLVFVNKLDRRGADLAATLRSAAARLTPALVPLGTVAREGTRDAAWIPLDRLPAEAVELLAGADDALLDRWAAGPDTVPDTVVRAALAEQTRRCLVHPVLAGSAVTGAGVDELVAAVTTLLPAAGGDPAAPVSGTVFTVARSPVGEKLAYTRLFAGTLRVRDRVAREVVTAIEVFDGGGTPGSARSVAAGQVAVLHGLSGIRVGDAVGAPPRRVPGGSQFPAPTLEAVVEPLDPADRVALHTSLARLAEQDPLIGYRHDPGTGEIRVSLFGEVQREVIASLLADDGVRVVFHATSPLCVEQVLGTGSALEVIGAGSPFLATLGLRVGPAPAGTGVRVELEVEPGSMPQAFFTAVRETVPAALAQGLAGWPVPDAVVTVTHTGYWARQSSAHGGFDASMSSTAGDFRELTPLVLFTALRRAGTRVLEPVDRLHLTVPADTLGPVLAVVAALGGSPVSSTAPGPRDGPGAECVVEGTVPSGRVRELVRRLPGLTRGEAVLETSPGGSRPGTGAAPVRARTGPDPLDRRGYLLALAGRGRPGAGSGSR